MILNTKSITIALAFGIISVLSACGAPNSFKSRNDELEGLRKALEKGASAELSCQQMPTSAAHGNQLFVCRVSPPSFRRAPASISSVDVYLEAAGDRVVEVRIFVAYGAVKFSSDKSISTAFNELYEVLNYFARYDRMPDLMEMPAECAARGKANRERGRLLFACEHSNGLKIMVREKI